MYRLNADYHRCKVLREDGGGNGEYSPQLKWDHFKAKLNGILWSYYHLILIHKNANKWEQVSSRRCNYEIHTTPSKGINNC